MARRPSKEPCTPFQWVSVRHAGLPWSVAAGVCQSGSVTTHAGAGSIARLAGWAAKSSGGA